MDAIRDLFRNPYDDEGFRECGVTGMDIHRSAENMVKLYGLTAVVALLVGGVFALFVALTRWELVGLLDASAFYKYLSIHAWYLLIFWLVFLEVAILYVGGPMVLGRKLPLRRLARAGWGVMVAGAAMITYGIWTTSGADEAPLLTSYVPLPSSAEFYLGVVVFILGTVVAALPFFVTIWKEKREFPGRSLPLITFGAFVTSIIAVEALVGGLITFVPTFLWRIEVIPSLDAAWYRQSYWIIGHGTQQINLAAMVTVWYFMTHIVGGAEVVSEKVSRSAFVLYLFFINLGAAHHLLSDPAASASWRIWNASYAAYGAALASMIHAFAIPAGLEAGRRKRGEGHGLFGWLWTAPWKDPGFSSTIFSIILFGTLGGITGIMMGQMQLNMTWHNTLATPGHFHGTVVTGTTVAFMGLLYYVIKLVFLREWVGGIWATVQPYLYSGAMALTVLMMMYLGVLFGVPRRHPSVMDIPGTEFSFQAAGPLFAIFGVAAVLAILGGALFIAIAVASLLFGDRIETPTTPVSDTLADGGEPEGKAAHLYSMRGTFVITLIFLGVFALMMALNWFLLAGLWEIGP